MNGKPVHVAAPSVPGRDQGPDYFVTGTRHDQRIAVSIKQRFESGNTIGNRGERRSIPPQFENRGKIVLACATDRYAVDRQRAPAIDSA
jgi:hypothetical protein